MANSTVSAPDQQGSTRTRKSKKDFPLSIHTGTGRWYKKVRGKFRYFGRVKDDPKGEAALNKWLDERDDLLAGRKPRQQTGGATVKYVCDSYYDAKRKLVESGELNARTLQQYFVVCERITRVLGRLRAVDDLIPEDFDKLRADIRKTYNSESTGNEIQRCRSVFKFAYDQRLIDRPVHYGQSFKKPSIKNQRLDRIKKGPRMFSAHELRQIIAGADPIMRAMLLLAINAAMGQSDLSGLPQSALDLEKGWLDYARGKTGVARRIPLWGETTSAVREAIALRPKPKDTADDDLTFLTPYGGRWVTTNKSGTPNDELGHSFSKLLKSLGLKKPGVSVYAARHTFRTVADEVRDPNAIDKIMGHTNSSVQSRYIEGISDDRLRAVVNHVHAWLYPRPTTA